ncbi:lysine N(6)-hydroxylase/L-ornithine N(5)-oxygenase family protein [Rossellomorea vietnamensis]|uniref:L-lysine N6-monooxygenase MbtG n=1 Tax=Rossellomorea vietnamensis TaxID=218284 RepID=A0A5D4MD71_9BACI|nr:FAD/NAD(P)-binding protein [Rossellomorea vietnamensis]TYR99794.1 lysine N(6)-hydroxylase/L-ornithine N(5)-oxygenase family protein [Rossellomorea vietnamensis]
MHNWIIIGGGIHGCTIAAFLLKSGRASAGDILIIDPNDKPLSNWKRNTERIGMEYLRSPAVHHIDLNPFSLKKAASPQDSRAFYGYYKRPLLSFFNEHSDEVLKQTGLDEAWMQGRVMDVTRESESWRVFTEEGDMAEGRNIVIAISLNDQPVIPQWAAELQHPNSRFIHHIFSPSLPDFEKLKPPIAVIGGGITAAHTCIKLSRLFPGKVTLLKRHPFRVHNFDSNPGWLGPKYMEGFLKLDDYQKRREAIQRARHQGSITSELNAKLSRLTRVGALKVVDGEVTSADMETSAVILKLKGGSQVEFRSVLLATGFQPAMPEQEWLKKLILQHNLQCAHCGYPIVKPTLEWCPHLYVSGPLAELEIGPVSRNISGARKAAERIVFNKV